LIVSVYPVTALIPSGALGKESSASTLAKPNDIATRQDLIIKPKQAAIINYIACVWFEIPSIPYGMPALPPMSIPAGTAIHTSHNMRI
jgi:hypothetical protein